MARPRNPETQHLSPPPHRRLDMTPFYTAAIFAMDADPRSPALPFERKRAMVDKAVDHVIDGDSPPAWVWKKDPERPDNHFLPDMWRTAVKACNGVKATMLPGGPS
jgi:hypothetical protein